jgi:hypothetical protein
MLLPASKAVNAGESREPFPNGMIDEIRWDEKAGLLDGML